MDVVNEDSDLLEKLAAQEMVVQLKQAVERCLTDQERQVIQLRYGLSGENPKRQREVAQITGISRSYNPGLRNGRWRSCVRSWNADAAIFSR